MAFGEEDLDQFLGQLRAHPEWRDAVRAQVLGQELLSLPQVVRELAEAQRRTEARVEQLAARVEELAEAQRRTEARVEELAEAQRRTQATVERLVMAQQETEHALREFAASTLTRFDALTGELGLLKGWQYELRFPAQAHVTDLVRRPRRVYPLDLDEVADARESGALAEEDVVQLRALDFLFWGRRGRGADAPGAYVALEVSHVVDREDVERARDRARILRRLGLDTIPACGGRTVTLGGRELAEAEGVHLLLAAGR